MSEKEETKRERERKTRRENFTSLWKSSLENKRLFSNYYPTTSSSRIFFIYALFATRLLLSRPPSLRKNLESAKDSCDRCLRDGIASRRKGKWDKISEKKSERPRYYFLTGQSLDGKLNYGIVAMSMRSRERGFNEWWGHESFRPK